MSGEKRRENLLKILQESTNPVSGTELAEKFNVSNRLLFRILHFLEQKITKLFLLIRVIF